MLVRTSTSTLINDIYLQTGNVVIDGKEHKLEPISMSADKRELQVHTGTPHMLEELKQEDFQSQLDYVLRKLEFITYCVS